MVVTLEIQLLKKKKEVVTNEQKNTEPIQQPKITPVPQTNTTTTTTTTFSPPSLPSSSTSSPSSSSISSSSKVEISSIIDAAFKPAEPDTGAVGDISDELNKWIEAMQNYRKLIMKQNLELITLKKELANAKKSNDEAETKSSDAVNDNLDNANKIKTFELELYQEKETVKKLNQELQKNENKDSAALTKLKNDLEKEQKRSGVLEEEYKKLMIEQTEWVDSLLEKLSLLETIDVDQKIEITEFVELWLRERGVEEEEEILDDSNTSNDNNINKTENEVIIEKKKRKLLSVHLVAAKW